MAAAAVYGIFIGVAFVLLVRDATQPAGSIVYWGFLAAQLAWGAAICWRRTGLPFATAAIGTASAASAMLATLAAAGWIFPDLPRAWWIPVGIGLTAPPPLLFVESRVNRAKWIRWKDFMEDSSALDILTVRHIPWLRHDGAGPAGGAVNTAHDQGSRPMRAKS